MSRATPVAVRTYVLSFLMAVALSCLWLGSDVFAGKKKTGPNPSDTGAANGVAHRVAALEAAMEDTQEALAEALLRIDVLEEDVSGLEDQVADLEERVAALEEAAAP